jgi:hypothetical protein
MKKSISNFSVSLNNSIHFAQDDAPATTPLEITGSGDLLL